MTSPSTAPSELPLINFQALSEFRYQIRQFLQFSERASRAFGLEPNQHQLLLAIKGLPEGRRPTIATIAERLGIQHHSAVELVDRLADRGAIVRKPGREDRREVLLELTSEGEAMLAALTLSHRDELCTAGPALAHALLNVMRQANRSAARR
jgi:DNA-binding MarR family transcriptional regulator